MISPLRAKALLAALLSACAIPSALVFAEPALAPSAASSSSEARVIVKFKSDSPTLRRHSLSVMHLQSAAAATPILQRRASELGSRHGRALLTGRGLSERVQVVTASGIDSDSLARSLATDSEVEYVAVDQRRRRESLPNDPLFAASSGISPAAGQWYLRAPTAAAAMAAGDIVSGINAPAAWDVTTGSNNIVVAVIDTGVRADHVDLMGRVLSGYDMISNTSIANDGSARDSDASDPGDYVTSEELASSSFSSCTVESSSWHGTQVSGLVGAASNNGIGMSGVTWSGKLLPVRVLGKCFGYDSDIIAGMRWAAGLTVSGVPTNPHPARVLNLSLGGSGSCTAAYSDAVSEIVVGGAVIVVAAGNGSGQAVKVPANCPGVIGVTGLRHAGTKVGFANLGSSVAIAAPGGNCVNDTNPCLYPMLSTTNAGTQGPMLGAAGSIYTDENNYAVGTSFSAPLVSGTAALMLAANPALTPSQVTQLLKDNARAFPSTGGSAGITACHAPNGSAQLECYCTTSTCGAGMLDAGAAVRAAARLAPGGTGPLLARVDASPRVPDPGTSVTLSSANTRLDTGRSVVSRSWSLVDGGGIVNGFVGGTQGPSAIVVPSASGRFTVALTVVDDLGSTSTEQSTVEVETLSVQIAAPPSEVRAGDTLVLSESGLQLSSGRSVASRGWLLLDGGGAISGLSGSLSGSSISLVPQAAGTLRLRLTVTDDLGKEASADVQVSVASSLVSASSANLAANSGSSGGGGGGGGAVSAKWLLGLAFATACLLALRRRNAGDATTSQVLPSRPLFLRGRTLSQRTPSGVRAG